MTDERRRFVTVIAPDWGQDHLSVDAIVAYVDGELADRPRSRAARHIAECAGCAAMVGAQSQARAAVRAAHCPGLPSSLLSSLKSIPQHAELPAPPDGLAVTPDGVFVEQQRIPRSASQARSTSSSASGSLGRRSLKVGAGAAFSGLALGALAMGAPGFSSGPPAPVAGNDRGVFNGSVLSPGVVDARLRLGSHDRGSVDGER